MSSTGDKARSKSVSPTGYSRSNPSDVLFSEGRPININEDPSLVSEDVAERLLARGRQSQRRKAELLNKREHECARNAEKSVPTSKGSELIASQNEGIRSAFNIE